MAENKPFVSIIIPVYHDWPDLERALNALERQTWPLDKFEIILVNNDPKEEFPPDYQNRNLCLAVEKKTGSYAARNRGIDISSGEILGFCDADCIPRPCWIEQAVQFLLEHPAYPRLAGNIELTYRNRGKPNYAEMHEGIFAFRQDWYAQNGASTTANMFAWRHVFHAVGMFDESLISGGDLEWGQRALKAGYGIGYCPEAIVRHPARQTLRELMEKSRRICSGYIRINNAEIKNHPLNAVYHGFCMIKPPIKAGQMIFANKQVKLHDKILIYFLEYLLKLVQFKAYVRCQLKASH